MGWNRQIDFIEDVAIHFTLKEERNHSLRNRSIFIIYIRRRVSVKTPLSSAVCFPQTTLDNGVFTETRRLM